MKNALKKIISYRPSLTVIAVILTVILLGSTASMMLMGLFSTPWYDDYSYTKNTVNFMNAYGDNLVSILRGALTTVRGMWFAWQGTYASIFFMALAPIIFGESMYFLGSWFLILFLTLSSFFMFRVVVRRVFGIEGRANLCISLAGTILITCEQFWPAQGYYWWNAGVHYIGMHSFLMLLVLSMIGFGDKEGLAATILQIVIGSVLSAAVAGANYITALQGILLLLLITTYTAFKYKKRAFRLIPVLIVYGLFFFQNVSAPGNSVRAAHFGPQANSPVSAVLLSFAETFKNMWKFTGIFTVLALVLLIPVIWQGLESSKVKFRLPGLFAAGAFCFCATCYTPGFYAMGGSDLARMLNVSKIDWLAALLFTEIYVLGRIKSFLAEKEKAPKLEWKWWVYAALAAVYLVLFIVGPYDRRFDLTPWGCLQQYHSGMAQAYHAGYERRIETIKASEVGDLTVESNIFKPTYLFHGELSDDPDYEANVFMADWYGLDSIRADLP